MSLPDDTRRRLRRLIAVAAVGLTLLGIAGAGLALTGAKAGIWPLVAADLVLTLAVLGLAWRGLR